VENTSGQGARAVVPAEIDRWNWGAFLLNWIWGIGNNTFIALLMFVPVANMVMPFVLGVKGSAWAWRNKRWDSVGHFRTVQRRWAKWGVIVLVAMIAAFAALIIFVSSLLKHSDAYRLAVRQAEASPQAVEVIGTPFTTGYPSGNIHESGPNGGASLSFSISGPKGSGTIFVEETRDLGRWRIDRMVLEQEGTGQRFDLAK
jgi:hypothetical protein